jgi:hypothetical protein
MRMLKKLIWEYKNKVMMKKKHLLLIVILFAITGCLGGRPAPYSGGGRIEASDIERMKYSIQVGAFGNVSNAANYTDKLNAAGVDAYFFLDDSGLYKVRIGDFPSYDRAVRYAVNLRTRNQIDDYFIIRPEDYDYNFRPEDLDRKGIRTNLVKTAHKYIGVPYRWGGESASGGFDCSGLTMVVYKLNGLNLPRNSRAQFDHGKFVLKSELKPGDLVFFATGRAKRVSHVGIYIGSGKFIHAPGRGRNVTIANLNDSYFVRTYMGARKYI